MELPVSCGRHRIAAGSVHSFALALSLLSALLLGAACGRATSRSPECRGCPPAPKDHVDDRAGLLPAEAARSLVEELTKLERDTGARIDLHIAQELPADEMLERYTLRCANCWGSSRGYDRNAVVLFIFQRQRYVRIEVSRALEAVLPDELCQRIIRERMIPQFREGDFVAGIQAAIRDLGSRIKESG